MVSNTLMQAILAMDAYNQGYNTGLDHGQTEIGNAEVILQSDINEGSDARDAGFYAVAYNYAGGTVISYRGTDNPSFFSDAESGGGDIWTGWSVGLGSFLAEQARLAAQFFEAVEDTTSNVLTLTGHSLGGGLAGIMASIYGRTATVFDSMPFGLSASNLHGFAI